MCLRFNLLLFNLYMLVYVCTLCMLLFVSRMIIMDSKGFIIIIIIIVIIISLLSYIIANHYLQCHCHRRKLWTCQPLLHFQLVGPYCHFIYKISLLFEHAGPQHHLWNNMSSQFYFMHHFSPLFTFILILSDMSWLGEGTNLLSLVNFKIKFITQSGQLFCRHISWIHL